MNHLPFRIAAIGLMLSCAPGLAADAVNQSIANKRQMVGCMIKKMRSNRSVTYLDAKKSCRDDLKAQNANLAASNSARGERPPAATAEPGS